MKKVFCFIILFFTLGCEKEQNEQEIFRFSKEEVFDYLRQNNLVKDSSEVKRITQKIIYPKREIDFIEIKYYIKKERDSLWLIHGYNKESWEDRIFDVRLSPKLKEIIHEEENNRPIPRYKGWEHMGEW
ncbi:hypothetical protein J2X97_002797 [Epilithonimonas hungarica]|uniref:hypothetical protein n=1 Tax=Epilithonimonas hungarica TaxID=454006 RepID=UPI00278A121B|nr:hypothetical protein [Epilithonimonas hungarica]MDP9957131.1 hypothetical protein [Epilithonimonas hungarica]